MTTRRTSTNTITTMRTRTTATHRTRIIMATAIITIITRPSRDMAARLRSPSR